MSKKNILKLYKNNTKIEVGIDEAGRGSLIGRVYAATVIWNPELSEYENNLEKKINEIKNKNLKNSLTQLLKAIK